MSKFEDDDGEDVVKLQDVGESALGTLEAAPDSSTRIRKRRRVSGVQAILGMLFVADTILSIVFVCIPDSRIVDRDRDALENSATSSDILTQLWLQFAASLGCALLSALSLILLVGSISQGASGTALFTAIVKLLCFILSIGNLAYPNGMRLGFVWTYISLLLIELAVLAFWLARSNTFYRVTQVKSIVEGDEEPESNSAKQLKVLDRYLIAQESRAALHKNFLLGQYVIFILGLLVFVLSIAAMSYEYSVLFSEQPAVFSRLQMDEMNDASRVAEYFSEERIQNDTRVLLVVLSGLRYDYLIKNERLNAFMSSIGPDSKTYKIKSSLPTHSVPNWAAMLTGAKPEVSGILGDAWTAELFFDSIFRQCKNYNVKAGITSSPDFAQLFASSLPYLNGDGSVSSSINANGEKTSDPADKLRGQVLAEAMQSNPPYDFFVAQFSNIDTQGHRYGVTKDFNSDDTYNDAITNTTLLLESIQQQMDSNTVMVIVSDHGQVNRGGHGGTDDDLVDVPLVIYQKGSNFNSYAPAVPSFDREEIEIIDIAATITAILGIPAPRQNGGVFIRDSVAFVPQDNLLKQYQDLHKQYQFFVQELLSELGRSTDDALLNNEDLSTIEEVVDRVTKLHALYNDERGSVMGLWIARNVGLTVLIALVVLGIFILMLQIVTYTEIIRLLSPQPFPDKKENSLALAWALISHAIYYGLSVLIFLIIYNSAGWPQWDITLTSDSDSGIRFIQSTLIPPTFVAWILLRMYYVNCSTLPPKPAPGCPGKISKMSKWLLRCGVQIFLSFDASNLRRLYLFKYYNIFVTIASMFVLFILQGGSTFIFPFIFDVKFFSGTTWTLRYRVLTMMLMTMPLFVVNLVVLLIWPQHRGHTSRYDKLFKLGIDKFLRKKQEGFSQQSGYVQVPTAILEHDTEEFTQYPTVRELFYSFHVEKPVVEKKKKRNSKKGKQAAPKAVQTDREEPKESRSSSD